MIRFKSVFFVGFAVTLIAMVGNVSAYTITVEVAPAAYSPVTTIPFALLPLGSSPPGTGYAGSAPISLDGESITFATAGGNPVTPSGEYFGNPVGYAFSPFGSADNTSNYLVAGDNGGTVTIGYATPQTELDLLWGTVDYYNQNEVFTLTVGGLSITGYAIYQAEVAQNVVPNYVNDGDSAFNVAVQITGLPTFTTALAEDAYTSPAFEFVPGVPVATPEPSTLVLFGVGAIALAAVARRRMRTRAA